MKKHLYVLILVWLILFYVGCSTVVGVDSPDLVMLTPTPAVANAESFHNLVIRSEGKVVLAEEYNLSFPIPGLISKILINEGEFVKKNDIIARLDTTTLRAEMVKSEAELAIAQAKLARVMSGPHESEITQAKIEVTAIAAQPYSNKAEATAQASDLAAAQARLDYLLALPLPEDVAVAQAEVNQAQLNVEAADALLKQAWLVAPSDGTVVRVLLKTHEYANVGETVAQMSNLEKLSVQTTVYDFEVVSIRIGETATVSFDALPGIVVEGSVYSIIPDEGDEQSGKYTIMIRLNEILEGLRWGLTANIEFPTE